jgi:hypothetical protein
VEERAPKVTPHLLDRALEMCPRRLAREYEDHDADAGAFTRWRVRAPFVDAAALAHRPAAGGGSPSVADFPAPPDLEPEEVAVWHRATGGYLARFADIAATTIEHGCAQATTSARFGVRVGGAVDLLVRLQGGGVELRQFELWGRPVQADPSRSWELALAVLRLARLLSGERLRIRHVDLLGGEADVAEFDYEHDLAALRDAFTDRLDALRARAASGDAVTGIGCGQCRHVAGCPAHSTKNVA